MLGILNFQHSLGRIRHQLIMLGVLNFQYPLGRIRYQLMLDVPTFRYLWETKVSPFRFDILNFHESF